MIVDRYDPVHLLELAQLVPKLVPSAFAVAPGIDSAEMVEFRVLPRKSLAGESQPIVRYVIYEEMAG